MASSNEVSRTRIRSSAHIGNATQRTTLRKSFTDEQDAPDIEEILPFLKDVKEGRSRPESNMGGKQNGFDEKMSPSSTKVDPTRIPKIGAVVFLLFVTLSQLQARIFNPSDTKSEGSLSTMNRNYRSQENFGKTGMNEDEFADFSFLDGNMTNKTDLVKSMTFVLPKMDNLPPELDFYAHVTEPLKEHDIPVLFHIPRTGGSTIKEITAECLNLIQASEIGTGVDPAAAQLNEVMVLTDATNGGQYINVDTTWLGGLERAKDLNLAQSGLVDVLVTPYYFQAGVLFDSEHRGRAFTMLRHPIERAISMYYYMNELALNGDEKMKTALNGMNLEQYAKSDVVENNWITRFLTNTLGGELTPEHEALAREILAQKFIIGLLSDRQQSLERFIQYFKWPVEGEKAEDCIDRRMGWNWANEGRAYPKAKEGSKVWDLLEEANSFDIRLFHYAEELFRMQSVLFAQ